MYTSQTKIPFYILTSNPQIIRGNVGNWKVARFDHASRGRGNTRINNEIQGSLSRNRITVSMQYVERKQYKRDSGFIKLKNSWVVRSYWVGSERNAGCVAISFYAFSANSEPKPISHFRRVTKVFTHILLVAST